MNIICTEIFYTGHVLKKMFAKNISSENVRYVIEKGEVIKSYEEDKPYPSFLMLAFINNEPLHVVAAKNNADQSCIIITAYEPDPLIWNPDFKTKKK